jgi:large subunit ribosomal protein L17
LGEHKLVNLLFNEIGPRFTKIQTGFTRIINFDTRRGDNAQIVVWELTEVKKKEAKKPKAEKEVKTEEEKKTELIKEKPSIEKKPETGIAVREKPPIVKKPTKKFLGGLRNIFKKERDSL